MRLRSPMPDGRPVFRNHLDAVQVAGGRVVSLVDPSPERRQEARARLPGGGNDCRGRRSSTSLTPGDADIVTIATPPGERLDAVAGGTCACAEVGPARKAAVGGSRRPAPNWSGSRMPPRCRCSSPTTAGPIRAMRAFLDETLGQGRAPRGVLLRQRTHQLREPCGRQPACLVRAGAVRCRRSPAAAADPDHGCISFNCVMASGLAAHVIGLPDVNYDMFEADIFLAEARVGYRNNGAEKFRYEARADLYYPGYPGLVEVPQGMARPIGGFVEMYRTLFACDLIRRADAASLHRGAGLRGPARARCGHALSERWRPRGGARVRRHPLTRSESRRRKRTHVE